jgi:hypothetical protein
VLRTLLQSPALLDGSQGPQDQESRPLRGHHIKSRDPLHTRERHPPERMSVAPCRVVRTDIRCSACSACTASTGRCHYLAAWQSQMAGVKRLFFGDFLLARQKKVTRLSGRVPTPTNAVGKNKKRGSHPAASFMKTA